VAAVVFVLVQVPPSVASLRDAVPPVHTVLLPRIIAGNGLTVTPVVRKQPPGKM
jgi:hypothetical protein